MSNPNREVIMCRSNNVIQMGSKTFEEEPSKPTEQPAQAPYDPEPEPLEDPEINEPEAELVGV
jgi:hypothetical protein